MSMMLLQLSPCESNWFWIPKLSVWISRSFWFRVANHWTSDVLPQRRPEHVPCANDTKTTPKKTQRHLWTAQKHTALQMKRTQKDTIPWTNRTQKNDTKFTPLIVADNASLGQLAVSERRLWWMKARQKGRRGNIKVCPSVSQQPVSATVLDVQ